MECCCGKFVSSCCIVLCSTNHFTLLTLRVLLLDPTTQSNSIPSPLLYYPNYLHTTIHHYVYSGYSTTTTPINPHDSSPESSVNGDNCTPFGLVSHPFFGINTSSNEHPEQLPTPNLQKYIYYHNFSCRGRIKAIKGDYESSFNGDKDRPFR